MKIEFYHVDAFEVANYEPIWQQLIRMGVDARLVAVPGDGNTAGTGWFDFERFAGYCRERGIAYATEVDPSADIGVTTQNAVNVREYQKRVRLMYGPVVFPSAWALQPHAVSPFDAVLVHGQAYVDRFSGWLSRERLPVIGYPRYDDFFSGKLQRAAIRARWGLTSSKSVLAFLPTWGDNTNFDAFFAAVAALSDKYSIILRPHHCTLRMEPQRMALMQASGLSILDNAYDLSEVYAAADVVVSDVRSGSLFEACMCNVPTVGLAADEAEINGWLAANGVQHMASLCSDPAQLEHAISEALASGSQAAARARWADQYVAHRDGSAAAHAAEALIQLASPVKTQISVPQAYTCKVSIVLPTYNHVDFLPQAITGILGQTVKDFELIIVNDGSTDRTQDFLAAMTDPRIKVINRENGGLPSALNRGFAEARGEYRTWTSADNVTGPTWLEQLVAALDVAPANVGFAYSGFALIDQAGGMLGVRRGQQMKYDSLVAKNPGMASFLYRSSIAAQVGEYDVSLNGAEDWDMWLRMLEVCDAVYVNYVLYYYRLHTNSMTSSIPDKVAKASLGALQKLRQRHGNTFDLDKFYPRLRQAADVKTAYWQAKSRLAALLAESPFCPVEWTVGLLVEAVQEKYTPQGLLNLVVYLCKRGGWDMAINFVDQVRGSSPSPQLDELRKLLVQHDARILQDFPIRLTPESELVFSLA
ncbi:glycosyltransferase [Undibacterium sp.]|uniref:glycosyltransferase n=1 Tax=Undibacterium sp. TaxID=1914977 RepID=UPI00374DEB0B